MTEKCFRNSLNKMFIIAVFLTSSFKHPQHPSLLLSNEKFDLEGLVEVDEFMPEGFEPEAPGRTAVIKHQLF